MIFQDKNQTLVPPEGYTLRSVAAEGAYLKLEYVNLNAVVVVYLTDQGRETGRVISERARPSFTQPTYFIPPDWSGTHPNHVKASNKFWATIKALYRFIIYHKRRKQ